MRDSSSLESESYICIARGILMEVDDVLFWPSSSYSMVWSESLDLVGSLLPAVLEPLAPIAVSSCPTTSSVLVSMARRPPPPPPVPDDEPPALLAPRLAADAVLEEDEDEAPLVGASIRSPPVKKTLPCGPGPLPRPLPPRPLWLYPRPEKDDCGPDGAAVLVVVAANATVEVDVAAAAAAAGPDDAPAAPPVSMDPSCPPAAEAPCGRVVTFLGFLGRNLPFWDGGGAMIFAGGLFLSKWVRSLLSGTLELLCSKAQVSLYYFLTT
mmetsp:Transcript_18953/g.30568  ORF Transcript_18953/g.30568 Transcript_18953/m.30568 type:complete len:267 (+) Transcript_18953:1178-1978(+)